MGDQLYQELLLRVTDLEVTRAQTLNPWLLLAAMVVGGLIVGMIGLTNQKTYHTAEAKRLLAERLEAAFRDFENLRIAFNIFHADIRSRRPYTVPAYMHPLIVIRARKLEGDLGIDTVAYKRTVDDMIKFVGTLPQSAHPLTSEEGKTLANKIKLVAAAIDHIQDRLSDALTRG